MPSVSQTDNDMLTGIPTLEEVKAVVFGMDINTAPGPDSFGAGFYQDCWDIIKDCLFLAVQDFFKSMEQPKGWSSSLLVLLPKIEGVSYWREFRPISLCNVSLKILFKLLANRINHLLPDLISPW